MKPLRRTLALLSLSVALCGCGSKAEEAPTAVGLVATFSGRDGPAGAHLKQGVELAVGDAVNQRVEGRRLVVVIADDRASDETVRAEAVRLLSVNRVAALIGGADAERAAVLARAAQPYEAPTVVPGDCAGPLAGDATFCLAVRPGWRGKILARYASVELKLKRAAVLTDGRNPVAVELASVFVQEWPRDEGFSVQQETFHADEDLQRTAARAADAKPDVVLIAADAPSFKTARTQLQGLSSFLLYGGEDVGADGLPTGQGEVVTATVFAPDALTERGQAFAKRYEEHFHEAPDLTAVQGYDAARLVFDAMARAKTAAADKVREQLAATADFESLTGPLRFKDGRARRPVFVVRVSGGQAQVVQRIEPESSEAPPADR